MLSKQQMVFSKKKQQMLIGLTGASEMHIARVLSHTYIF
jgi:hypothetical protein